MPAPHAVYLADAKGTRGRIDVYQSKWHPEGRASFRSPLLNLRKHARVLHGVLVSQNPDDPQIGSVFVDAVVILTAPNARLFDPGRRDCRRVVTQSGCAKFLRDKERVPGHFLEDTRGYHNLILQILNGNTRPKKGALRFRDWVVLERLSGTEEYTEYRAHHRLMGQRDTVLLRVYQADPYLPETERKAQQRLLSNAYTALNKLHHPAIVGVRDFFATEAEDQYVLVTEDVAGDSLYTLNKQGQLTLKQKFRVLREILAALDHARSHDVIHRNINPADILLGKGGEPRLINFEHARTGGSSAGAIAG
ncbi:MAG: protein kinase, partial [Gammaproteobacteria bacterium]|nr:protein kinase [Gammaproteobacteria bacterium]